METKIFITYSMDFTSQRQHAQNADGVWFSRSQYRDPRYGYKWGKWTRSFSAPTFSDGTPKTQPDRTARVRLPKVAA